jgi:hypothetical protein
MKLFRQSSVKAIADGANYLHPAAAFQLTMVFAGSRFFSVRRFCRAVSS